MLDCFAHEEIKNAIPIELVTQENYVSWFAEQSEFVKKWLDTTDFRLESGKVSLIPNTTGELKKILYCIHDENNFWGVGQLPYSLPEGNYDLYSDANDLSLFYLAWGLGAYQFLRYKKTSRQPAKLVLKKSHQSIEDKIKAIYLVRDLINTPTEEMGPSEFASIVMNFAKEFKVEVTQILGDDLLKQNYPCIHLVGRASDDPPRLLDLRWGNKKHPRVTLVGKGVCFDSGGLDIKPSSAMLLMKKDMAGAAHVLGLGHLLIAAQLPVQLRILMPVVENVISGNAYRPGDVVRSRQGMTIEIGNTDAEGRVILADALTEAVSESPDLLIDIATLTGAARVALGTELPAMFVNQDTLANDILLHANKEQDFVWRMPFFSLYRDSLNSSIADINNNSSDAYGGAITAALFLKEFVPDRIPWVHLDLMAWNLKSRPGRPVGGEAMALRALFSYIKNRFIS